MWGDRSRWLAVLAAVASAVCLADPLDMRLAAQPLSTALREFTAQTGVQVAIQSQLASGKMAPAVSGRYEPAAALAALLRGSGLTAYQINPNTYGIREAQHRTAEPSYSSAPEGSRAGSR